MTIPTGLLAALAIYAVSITLFAIALFNRRANARLLADKIERREVELRKANDKANRLEAEIAPLRRIKSAVMSNLSKAQAANKARKKGAL